MLSKKRPLPLPLLPHLRPTAPTRVYIKVEKVMYIQALPSVGKADFSSMCFKLFSEVRVLAVVVGVGAVVEGVVGAVIVVGVGVVVVLVSAGTEAAQV